MNVRYKCYRCMMGFDIEDRTAHAESNRCPECKMAFSSGRNDRTGKVRCSITPSDYAYMLLGATEGQSRVGGFAAPSDGRKLVDR